MDGKVVAAFAGGALLASGIVYMAVRPVPAPKPPAVAAVTPKPVLVPAPAVSAEKPAEALTAPAPAPAPAAARRPVREKPSPMPPPVRRENPATVARNQEPPQESQPPETIPPAPAEPQPPAAPVPPAPTPAPAPAETVPAPQPPVATPAEPTPPPAPEPERRTPNTVTLAAGTMLPVRIGETISSSRNQPGDSFLATLEQPLVIDGFIIAERGARVEGRIVEAAGGRASHLGIELVRLSTSDGQRIRIRTDSYKKDSSGSTGSDLAKIGAGAAVGAAIGAIAGGGKGAAIGAGAGAAAGAGVVLVSSGRAVEIPVETRLSFRVQEQVTITEKID